MKRWRIPAAGTGVALLLVVGFYVAIRQPQAETISELEAQAAQLRSQQAPLRRDINGLEKVAAGETGVRAALRRLEQLIPSGLGHPPLLTEMQRAATQAGVEVVSVTFGDPEVPEGAPENPLPGTVVIAMPVTVIVNGPFPGIIELLRRVEVEFERALLVRNVAFNEAPAGFPQVSGTWSGHAYALLQADDPLVGVGGKPGTAETPSPRQARP